MLSHQLLRLSKSNVTTLLTSVVHWLPATSHHPSPLTTLFQSPQQVHHKQQGLALSTSLAPFPKHCVSLLSTYIFCKWPKYDNVFKHKVPSNLEVCVSKMAGNRCLRMISKYLSFLYHCIIFLFDHHSQARTVMS